MMSLWDALRMNMMISYQELVRTFPIASNAVVSESFLANYVAFIDLSGILIILQYFFAASHLVRVSASEMFG